MYRGLIIDGLIRFEPAERLPRKSMAKKMPCQIVINSIKPQTNSVYNNNNTRELPIRSRSRGFDKN